MVVGVQDGSLDVDEMRDMWKMFGVAEGQTVSEVVALTFFVILDKIKCSPNCRNFIEPKLPKQQLVVEKAPPAPVQAATPDDDEVRAPAHRTHAPSLPRVCSRACVCPERAKHCSAALRCGREGVLRCYHMESGWWMSAVAPSHCGRVSQTFREGAGVVQARETSASRCHSSGSQRAVWLGVGSAYIAWQVVCPRCSLRATQKKKKKKKNTVGKNRSAGSKHAYGGEEEGGSEGASPEAG
jgi:hypothetical protein